jgi:hypothetical protein
MSLKAIKKAVDELDGAFEHPNTPAELRSICNEALAEITALEKAAKVLDSSKSGDDYSETELRDAFALMESIVEEAK